MEASSIALTGESHDGKSSVRDLQDQTDTKCNISTRITCKVKGQGSDCEDLVVIPGKCESFNATFRLFYCNLENERMIQLLGSDETILEIETKTVEEGVDRSDMLPRECRTVKRFYEANTCEKSFSASIKVEGWVEAEDKSDYCYSWSFLNIVLTVAPTHVTQNPTKAPTKGLTENPTKTSTTDPTDVLITETPIRMPSSVPSINPTKYISDKPTDTVLTVAPTHITETPTMATTKRPTQIPTKSFTHDPTNIPTDTSTDALIVVPTHAPHRDTSSLVSFRLECFSDVFTPGIYDTACDEVFHNDQPMEKCDMPIMYKHQWINGAHEAVSILSLITIDESERIVNQFDEFSSVIIEPGDTYKLHEYESIDACNNYGKMIEKNIITELVGILTSTSFSLERTEIFEVPDVLFAMEIHKDIQCIIDDETGRVCQDYIDLLEDINSEQQCTIDAIYRFTVENIGQSCKKINNIMITIDENDKYMLPLEFMSNDEKNFCPEDVLLLTQKEKSLDICELLGASKIFKITINDNSVTIHEGISSLTFNDCS